MLDRLLERISRIGVLPIIFAYVFLVTFSSMAILQSCGTGYSNIDSENGRNAIMEQADQFLSAGQCARALEILGPLYTSQYVDDKIRMSYASAFACAGGFNFISTANGLTNASGNDIYSGLVLGNYSLNANDGKVISLSTAANIVRETRRVPGSIRAVDRPSDANLYMIFMQLELITVTISTSNFGDANPQTGAKRLAITGKGSNAEKCRMEVAIATISDCLTYVSAGTALSKIKTQINNLCGGACPSNLDPNVCTAVEQVQGAAVIAAIDASWSF